MSEHESSAIERILARAKSEDTSAALSVFSDGKRAQALDATGPLPTVSQSDDFDGVQQDLADRASLRRVAGLSTELEDVTEVEYRQLRLEKVVLIGVYPQGSQEEAENSLRELAALCETAGAAVLDGVLQRRPNPDPATYLGRGKV